MDPQLLDDADSSPEPSTPAGVELGQLLTRWREESNRSQSVVARKLGTRQPTVSRWESGTSLPTTEVVRALWRLRNREAEPAAGDTQLTEALALHRRAETERNRAPVPVAAVPSVPVPPAVPPVEPQAEAAAGRGMTAARSLLAVCGLTALLLGLVFLAQHFAGSTPSGGTEPAPAAGAEAGTGAGAGPVTALATPAAAAAAAKPSPPVACGGDSCTSVEPEGSVCAGDAVTAYTGRRYGVLVELRYSPACQAAWAKMRGASPGDRIMLTLQHDEGNAQEYRQRDGKDAHTPMAHVVDLSSVRACAVVEGRGTVCATKAASPTTRP